MSLGCLENDFLSKRFTVNDVIYGNISFSPLVKSIVDTEHFQRLRNIKQLGVSHFVYPSAVHSRFEHSIGTAYLCRKFLLTLQENINQSAHGLELKRKLVDGELITGKDIVCVELAGLLHDLGHGPFSHMFEKIDESNPYWTHEEMSCRMIDHLIETNIQVQTQLNASGLTKNDIKLVKQLILGATPNGCGKLGSQEVSDNFKNNNNLNKESLSDNYLNDNSNNIPYCTLRDDPQFKIKKWFLFQIVSNKFNGIDCDKFDYMMRDCHYVGVSCNFDYTHYFQNCQLLQTTLDGIYISPRDKEFLNVNELFYSRWRLHRKVYQHKTVRPVEMMVVESIRLAKNYFHISQALTDPNLFLKLTDHIFYQILYSDDPLLEKSKHILTSITKRKILKLCGQVTLNNILPSSYDSLKTKIHQEILKHDSGKSLSADLIHVEIIDISSGMDVANPINSIVFHTKNGQLAKLRPQCVSNMIPKVFSDKILRVYFGSIYDGFDADSMESLFEHAANCFQSWCSNNDLPLPHAISINDPSGCFTHFNLNKRAPLKRNSEDDSFRDDKITKKLHFNDP